MKGIRGFIRLDRFYVSSKAIPRRRILSHCVIKVYEYVRGCLIQTQDRPEGTSLGPPYHAVSCGNTY